MSVGVNLEEKLVKVSIFSHTNYGNHSYTAEGEESSFKFGKRFRVLFLPPENV